MELKGNAVFFSKEPIEVKESTPITAENVEWVKGKGDSFSFTIKTKVSRKILRWMTLGDRRHSRFMKQLAMLKYNPKHSEVILRCVRYRNKVQRKYMRMYKEVIKRIIITKNYGKDRRR